jgi:hypothetical protein
MNPSRELINRVNRSELERFRKFSESTKLSDAHAAQEFRRLAMGVQAVIVHTYPLAAQLALREENPKISADIWGEYIELCDSALDLLRDAKTRLPQSDADSLYDLTLDYRNEALERQQQNLRAAECEKMQIPAHWFPSQS